MAHSASLGVVLDHVQDKVVLLDEGGRVTYANDAVKRILGFEPDDFVGENVFDYIHPDDVTQAREVFQRTIDSETFTETTVEYRHRSKDDSWVWLQSRMSNLTDAELDGYVVSSRDVSAHIEAKREREEAIDRLEELAATSGDVLWMFNGDWSELLFINPAYEEIYGAPATELKDDPSRFLDAIHPDDVPAVTEAMDWLSSGNSVDMEYRVNPRTNYNRWVWVQAEPIVEDGDVVRITGFTRDITDRRRRERQLYVMDNLLRHNLRNDLNLILGNADLIEDEAPTVADRTEVIRRTGEDLLRSADKERQIIDLLTTDVARQRFELRDAIETGLDTIRERFPEVQIDVSICEQTTVYALEELRLAVVELLENAIHHSDAAHPTVSVSVSATADTVTITFADRCPSIPPIEANVLTGDHDMSDVYHSSGLGLWLTYWIVDLSGGEISVTSDQDGNTITIALPRPKYE